MEAYRYLPAMMHLHTPNQTLSSSAFRWKSCCMDVLDKLDQPMRGFPTTR